MSISVAPLGSFGSKLSLNAAELPKLDAEFEEITEGEERGTAEVGMKKEELQAGWFLPFSFCLRTLPDGPEWQKHIGNKKQRRELANQFKDANNPFKIVIVRDMWLTGFDAPSLHTMYADKPMQGHSMECGAEPRTPYWRSKIKIPARRFSTGG